MTVYPPSVGMPPGSGRKFPSFVCSSKTALCAILFMMKHLMLLNVKAITITAMYPGLPCLSLASKTMYTMMSSSVMTFAAVF